MVRILLFAAILVACIIDSRGHPSVYIGFDTHGKYSIHLFLHQVHLLAQVVHTIVTRVIRVWNQGEFSIVATSVITTSSLRFKWVVPPLFYLMLLSAFFEIFIIVNIDKK